MPFKTWVVGEEVLAADFNDYIQEQVVAVFADAAARNTAITSPIDGQVCYLTGSDELLVYNGTAWATPTNLGGTWNTFTPAGLIGSNPATFSPHDCAYRHVGKQIQLDCAFQFSSGTGVGDNVVRFQMPSPARLPTGMTYPYGHAVGVGIYITPGPATYPFVVTLEDATYMVFRPTQWPASPAAITGASPVAIAAGVEFHFTAAYRIT